MKEKTKPTPEQEKNGEIFHENQMKLLEFLSALRISETMTVAILCKTMVEFCMLGKIKKPIILSRVSETYEILDNIYEGKL
jgi:hypothetical protein